MSLSNHDCYTDDWQRTQPDYVIYLPKSPGQRDEYADHIHVFATPGGDTMCIWTQASYEGAPDLRVVYSRSADGGRSWSPCLPIAEPSGPKLCPGLGFPLVSRSGRIYCLYNQHPGIGDLGHWQGPLCIIWQQPIRDAKDRAIVGFSRWSSLMTYPRPLGGNRSHLDTQCELMRFDNLDDGPDAQDLEITWLPDEEGTIRVSCGIEPDASRGYSLAEEPAIALLPDGRLWMNMRTVTGRIWYTVSDDDGHSWREPEVLRYQGGGDEVLHTKSPTRSIAFRMDATCSSITIGMATIRVTPDPGIWRPGVPSGWRSASSGPTRISPSGSASRSCYSTHSESGLVSPRSR